MTLPEHPGSVIIRPRSRPTILSRSRSGCVPCSLRYSDLAISQSNVPNRPWIPRYLPTIRDRVWTTKTPSVDAEFGDNHSTRYLAAIGSGLTAGQHVFRSPQSRPQRLSTLSPYLHADQALKKGGVAASGERGDIAISGAGFGKPHPSEMVIPTPRPPARGPSLASSYIFSCAF